MGIKISFELNEHDFETFVDVFNDVAVELGQPTITTEDILSNPDNFATYAADVFHNYFLCEDDYQDGALYDAFVDFFYPLDSMPSEPEEDRGY